MGRVQCRMPLLIDPAEQLERFRTLTKQESETIKTRIYTSKTKTEQRETKKNEEKEEDNVRMCVCVCDVSGLMGLPFRSPRILRRVVSVLPLSLSVSLGSL